MTTEIKAISTKINRTLKTNRQNTYELTKMFSELEPLLKEQEGGSLKAFCDQGIIDGMNGAKANKYLKVAKELDRLDYTEYQAKIACGALDVEDLAKAMPKMDTKITVKKDLIDFVFSNVAKPRSISKPKLSVDLSENSFRKSLDQVLKAYGMTITGKTRRGVTGALTAMVEQNKDILIKNA